MYMGAKSLYYTEWSNEEIEFLRQVYRDGGVQAFQVCFDRSVYSIWSKARELGIHTVYRRYNEKEIVDLKRLYPKGKVDLFLNLYPDRTYSSAIGKAVRLGLRSYHHFYWSKQSIASMHRNYPKHGWRYFAWKHRVLTKYSVQKKAHELGLKLEDRGYYNRGEKAYNWCGGVSFFPYPTTFNTKLKEFVREYYGRVCLNCQGRHSKRRLDVHHIDYEKNNIEFVNLVPLCLSCHTKTRFNRDIWKVHLTWLRDGFLERKGILLDQLATSMSMSESLPRVNQKSSLLCSPRPVDNVGGLSQQVVKNG